MANNEEPKHDQAMIYEIRIEGHLSPMWEEEFEGWTITREDNGETLLTGEIIDQSALHGLLKRIRNLGIAIIEFKRITQNNDSSAS